MVFDVPADSGGALSILNEFYSTFEVDKKNNYIFVLGVPYLEEKDNIKVLRYPWVKKSWLHRLYFDNFIAPKLIQKYKSDKVLSLQNIMIPRTNVFQTVYVHNSLPFSEYRFSFFENKLLWIYQNVLSRGIFKSIIKADRVIVQTEWMKNACLKKLKVNKSKIDVILPKVDFKVTKYYKHSKGAIVSFFYPASGVSFKNHQVIIDACLGLSFDKVFNYEVIFTLSGNENKNILNLYKESEKYNLPIKFIGCLNKESVFDYYTKSILLFPSYIETVGLPMLEAKMHKAPIIASDCAFSHEILNDYEKAGFFNPFDANELKLLMQGAIRE